MLSRLLKLLLPGLLLCAVGVYRAAFPPTGGAASDLNAMPLTLLDLPGENITPEQTVLDELNPDDMLIRRYTRPDGIPIWLVIIYFVNSRRGGHDPQICYYSQGYHTTEAPEVVAATALGPIRAESFVARRPWRSERVLTFWYTPGGRIVPDVTQYRRTLFLQGILENRSYGAFVRISTLDEDRPGEAEEWNRRFFAEVAQQLPRVIKE